MPDRDRPPLIPGALLAVTVWLAAPSIGFADDGRQAVPTPASNSVASATSGIQEAIDDLPSDGGQVYLSEGVYEVTQSVRLPSNVSLVGSGAGSVVKLADGAGQGDDEVHVITNSDPENGNHGIRVANLVVDGNYANQAWGESDIGGCGIAFDHANDVTIENVHVTNTWRHGIWYHNGRGAVIRNVVSETAGSNNISIGGQYHFRRFTQNVTIAHATMRETRREIGRSSAGNGGLEINDHIRNVTVSDCIAYDHPTGSGFVIFVHARGHAEQHVQNVALVNCIAYDSRHGFYVRARVMDVSELSLSNCIAYDNARHGYSFAAGDGGELRNLSVQGSVSRANGADGVRVSGAEVLGFVLSGNRLADNGGHGVSLRNDASEGMVTHNVCRANEGFGIDNRASAARVSENLLRENEEGAMSDGDGT